MAWGQLKLHAGDFKGQASFNGGSFHLFDPRKSKRESIGIARVAQLEIASEENVRRLSGTVGWGITGAALLGPVGLMAGLLAGGRSKDVTFVCVFNDGRKLLATTSGKDYTKILGAQMDMLPSRPQRSVQDQEEAGIIPRVQEWSLMAVCPDCGCEHEWVYRARRELPKSGKPRERLCQNCLHKRRENQAEEAVQQNSPFMIIVWILGIIAIVLLAGALIG